ncbi:phosphorybosylanthranilate isomerase [Leptolyngbyaceae cyanobacterium CCMR0082]|uniref:Phosphorybosylanthranilate isomerase n=2 Tax=Adonisia turfae TaxID=2950184 RepID=A0A6M0S309_9CYAN|nr:BtpA/SgcQ family protein [Leptothoe sp. LEGE 181152]NEZ54933.1 phosphorybosylanthranilate isomerase [Adonisia turfae CCMR0081]NEZ62884.1 phosphorybosylanthranilate isomerase [Adonisia turfae CCMR0082]
MELQTLFKTSTPVIGVVHLLPLPASARWQGSLQAVVDRAVQEAVALASGGANGIIIENFFDAPFTKGSVDPAVVSAMTIVVSRIQQLVTLPLGINVLRNDAQSGLAIAACTGAAFIRVNVLTGVMATDQGVIEGDAHRLMRYRRELGRDIKVFADVLVKHATPVGTISPDTAMANAVADTIHRGLADAVIVSGGATGHPPTHQDLATAKAAAGNIPVLIGSGATVDNIPKLMKSSDGVIVSSSLKRWGHIEQPVDPNRVSQFVDAISSSP